MAIRFLSGETIDGDATFAGSVGIGGVVTPDRSLDVEGDGIVIIGSGSYTELMLRNQTENSVRNVGAWHWSLRPDVGGDNDDLKLLRFVTGSYAGIALQFDSSNSNATFSGDVMPAAENLYDIGSASVRWEGLYVDDGYIRNAYIDSYLYHNGNTNNHIRFQTNRMQLFANFGTAGYLDLHDNGNVYIGASNATAVTITSSSATFAGDITGADNFKATGANMKLWAGGTHVLNIDVNRNIYPQSHNSTDLGFSSALAFRTLFLSGDIISGGAITATGSATFGNTQINGTLGVSSNINTSGILTANAINTNAYLVDGTAADLYGRYLGQGIYGSGTGSGDNYGTVADVLRYKDIEVWRKNSSTNVWSNPSDGDALVNGNYAHSWGGINMEPAYSEYVFYFSNTLGYSFVSQTIIQHSTNGNSFNLYIERASSTTNPYDTTGWTTMVTQTGISSWPGITCNQSTWEVGGGYPGLFRIRLVPTWNNGNVINIGSFQGYGSYGNFQHAWSTLFDRSVNFQSKIGVGTNPSRALDVTQEALIQGIGNVNMGTLALGPRASGVGKWSTISGAHYNQSSGGGNGSGAAGIMMIGTYGANGENDVYVGGGLYEINAATNIRFYTHTTDTSTAGGSIRMGISSSGRVTINTTVVADAMCTIAGNSSNYALNLYADSIYSGIYRYQRFRSGSNIAGGIEGSNQTSVQYVTTSDYRTKKNIKPLENGLDRVCKLKPVKFDWKLNNETTEGFIAHEVQDIFPEAVSGEKDGEDMQGMDYGRITPLLVAAIQELKAEIEILKSK